MKRFLLLILLLLPLAAKSQVGPSALSTNAWLWCRTPAAATNTIKNINASFGYPNTATLTWTAVPLIYHPTTNWVLIPITIDVYSHVAKKSVTVASVVPTNILGSLGTNIPPSAITTNRQITEATAIANGFWPTNK